MSPPPFAKLWRGCDSMNAPSDPGTAGSSGSGGTDTRIGGLQILDPRVDKDWLATVSSLDQASVFHHPSWCSVLSRTYGFKSFYLHHRDPSGRGMLLPLMEVRKLSGKRKAVSLPFTDSCPILCTEPVEAPDPEVFRAANSELGRKGALGDISAGVRRLARERGWSEVEFRLGLTEREGSESSVSFYSHVVELDPTDAGQMALAESSVRRCLKKFQTGPMTVTIGTGMEEVRQYYGLHCVTRKRQGSPPQPWRFFTNIQEELLGRGMGYVVLVSLESKPIAGAVFLHRGRRAMYKFGASDLSFQHLRPNHGVMWTGLRHGARLGCVSMDLGRTSLDNDGLRRFKMGWGSVETRQVYHCLDVGANSWRRLVDRTTGWQTHVFRRSPIWLSRMVGQWVYRYAA